MRILLLALVVLGVVFAAVWLVSAARESVHPRPLPEPVDPVLPPIAPGEMEASAALLTGGPVRFGMLRLTNAALVFSDPDGVFIELNRADILEVTMSQDVGAKQGPLSDPALRITMVDGTVYGFGVAHLESWAERLG